MIRPRLGLALALGWLLALSPPAILAGTPTPADDVRDLLFLGGPHPVFIRLHIQLGDRPLDAAWRDAIDKLHAYLDSDGDGILKRDEAERVDWLRLVRVFRRFRPSSEFRLPDLDVGLQDGIVSAEELADFVRAICSPLFVQTSLPSVPESSSDVTFARLDTDGDGALARGELERAADVLRMHDQNDDEMISPAELTPYRNPIFAVQARREPDVGDPEPSVVLLGRNESRTRLAQQLLKRFDIGGPDGGTTRDRRLSRAEAGLGSKEFASFDGDGDGTLDSDELMQLLDRTEPALEVIVRIGGRRSQQPVVEVVDREDKERSEVPRAQVRVSGDSMLTVELGGVWIEIRSADMTNEFDRTRQQLLALGRNLDKDNDKALSSEEVRGREPLQSLFPFMDRHADDKVNEEEMIAALDVLDELARGHALLEVTDRGMSLFGTIDTRSEGRLSLRELRAAGRRLAAFDRDGDGRVAPDEVPRRFEWLLSHGPMTPLFRDRTGSRRQAFLTDPIVKGPLWFQKMDRNHDGDLSPREFLGARAEFRRLDADDDGLIDDREAAQDGHTP